MSDHKPINEQPRLEDHRVYALLAIPIFAVSIFIIVLIATLGSKNP